MACFKSEIRSSASSIPTLSLIKESTTPEASLSILGMEAWVIEAGWPARLSTPPRDSARVNTLSFSIIFNALLKSYSVLALWL